MTQTASSKRVLVSDFDGTMTRQDFFKLVIAKLLPPGTPDYWTQYRNGEITHFEALRRYFASIRASEKEVLQIVAEMELDPQLPAAIESLEKAGWKIIVASAGCDWYIKRLLAEANVSIEVHANPGRFEAGKGLLMEMPIGSPFFSQALGVDKTGIVKHYLAQGYTVAFAGDGFPDAEAARLVSNDHRFARGDLESVLQHEHLPFHPFNAWSDIASVLLGRD